MLPQQGMGWVCWGGQAGAGGPDRAGQEKPLELYVPVVEPGSTHCVHDACHAQTGCSGAGRRGEVFV